MKKIFKKTSGVTLIELLVGAGIFITMMSIASTTGFMIYQSKKKIERTNMLYTETRFVMDRLVREVRVNSIDYYEYFSHNISKYDDTGTDLTHGLTQSGEDEYGKNPGLYELFFYLIPNDGQPENDVSSSSFSWKTADRGLDIDVGYFNTGADATTLNDNDGDENSYDSAILATGIDPSAPNDPFLQKELYLLSTDGLTKTIIRSISDTIDGDSVGRIAMAKMTLTDTDSDGVGDKWNPHTDFKDVSLNLVFHPITPSTINVTEFKIIVSPLDDPRKGFAESIKSDGENPHIQPHVIFRIGAKLSDKKYAGLPGQNLEFSLQTSAVSRVLTNVTFPRP